MKEKDELKELLRNININGTGVEEGISKLFESEVRVLFMLCGDKEELSKVRDDQDDVKYSKLYVNHVTLYNNENGSRYYAVFSSADEIIDKLTNYEGIVMSRISNMIEASCIFAYMRDKMGSDLKNVIVNPFTDHIELDGDAIYELGKKMFEYLDEYSKGNVTLDFNDK